MKKRIVSLLLTVCMVCTMLPMQALVSTEGIAPLGLTSVQNGSTPTVCQSHTAHDEACGCTAAAAAPCGHLQEGGTYSCDPALGDGSVGENKTSQSGANYGCDHSDACGYAEAVVEVSCNHLCEVCKTAVPLT